MKSKLTVARILAVVILLLAGFGTPYPGYTAPAPSGGLLPQTGELRLDGIIVSVDSAAKSFVLAARSFTLPNGKTGNINPPKPKTVFVGERAVFRQSDDGSQALTLAQLKVGLSLSVIGKDGGGGQALPAREIAVHMPASAPKALLTPLNTQNGGNKRTALNIALRPELDLQLAHTKWINSIALSPDGTLLASCAADAIVKLWDTRSGELRKEFVSPTGGEVLQALAFSPDGKTLAAGGGPWLGFFATPGEILLWDVQSGTLKQILKGHAETVFSVAFSSDGKTLVSGDGDGEVILWDIDTRQIRQKFEDAKQFACVAAISPDGKTLVTVTSEVSNHRGLPQPAYKLRLWDLPSGKLRREVGGFTRGFCSIKFLRGGATVALGSSDRNLYLYDTITGERKQVFRKPGGQDTDWVISLDVSSDGRMIVSGHDDGIIRLWDASTGELKRELIGHGTEVNGVRFSLDGKSVFSGAGDNTVRQWDIATGTTQRIFGTQPRGAWAVAVSSDGKILASGYSDNAVRLWDTRTGELLRVLNGHQSGIHTIAFSPDGKTLASGVDVDLDKTPTEVRLWDVASGRLLTTLNGHSGTVGSVTFSHDGKLLATGGWDRTIRLWDAHSGELLGALHEPQLPVTSVVFSPDDKTLASGGGDAWMAEEKDKNKSELWLWDVPTRKVRQKLKAPDKFVFSVAFSPDGKLLVTGSGDNTIRLWDAVTGAQQRVITGGGSAIFAPDGKSVVSRERGATSEGGDRTISTWDIATGALQRKFQLRSGEVIYSFAFASNPRILVVGTSVGTVDLWDQQNGRQLASFLALPSTAGAKPIDIGAKPIDIAAKAIDIGEKAIDISDKTITTGSDERQDNSDDYLVFTPQGYYSGSPGSDRYVHFRLKDTLYPAESFQVRYYRPDLVKRALAGAELPPPATTKSVSPPLVAIATPHLADKVAGNSVTVRLEASGDTAISKVIFFVNGTRVDAKPIDIGSKTLPADTKAFLARSKDLPASHTVYRSFTVDVPLPQSDSLIKLQAVAVDAEGLQSPRDEVLFSHEAAAVTAGTLRGLCVGVSRYSDAGLNLRYADRDAAELSKVLNQQRGVYRDAQVTALTNEQATRQNVKGALDKLVQQTTQADTVIVLLSGHGWRSSTYKFYFATSEVNRKDVENTTLAWSDVVDRLILLSQKSRRVIVLLDACHSGSAVSNDELVKALLGANAGVIVLASSKGSEVSLELADQQHGAFTQAVLEAIGGAAAPKNKKTVALRKFIDYVQDRVAELTGDAQHPHVPFLEDFDTDAALVAKNEVAGQTAPMAAGAVP